MLEFSFFLYKLLYFSYKPFCLFVQTISTFVQTISTFVQKTDLIRCYYQEKQKNYISAHSFLGNRSAPGHSKFVIGKCTFFSSFSRKVAFSISLGNFIFEKL